MDPLAGFSASTRAWFESAFGEPTPVQAATWPKVRAGASVLAIAPTGSGKTLAAFLWAIDRCLAAPRGPGVRVLYVSPLKALAIDVERNLRAPLAGIAAQAQHLGLPGPRVTVGVRTGDTPASERRAMHRRAPDVLITTPESLFLMLTSATRSILATVETVIVDEVHAIAGSKRGAHLAVSLARLDHLAGRTIPRIGLSATVEPPELAARFLASTGAVEVVRVASAKEWDLTVEVPVEDMADLGAAPSGPGEPTTSIWPHVEARIVDLIAAHRSTLVFANSRRLAERLTARINEIHAERQGWADPPGEGPPAGGAGPGPPARTPAEVMAQAGASAGAPTLMARAHHGSVSKEQRALIEEDLKTGRLPAVVATSSLELGIDMGAVDLVIQVESPPSVSSGLQRVGRAGHQVGAVSQGVVMPKFRGDLLAASVVVDRMRSGVLEALRIPRNPLDVAAQQVVACVAMDDWTSADLLAMLRRTASFADLTPAVFESVVEMLAGRYPSDAFAELRPRIIWDRETDTLRARPGAQGLAVTSGGTIPDRGLFAVHLVSGGRVGELDEEMVYESRVGDAIALGASTWRIVEITHDRVLVEPAGGVPGRLPFWRGDALGRTAELGRAIGAFTRQVAAGEPQAVRQRLSALGLDPWAAGNLVDYVAEQAASGSHVPTDRTLVVETSRDELGDWRVTVLSPFGARVHAPWALLARERLRERFGVDAAVLHGDDGIVARLPDLPGDDWLAQATDCLFPPAEDVEAEVTRLVGSSALFASRFRECASRALLLPRPRPGRRAPLWQQRQRSAQLLQIAAEHPTFPIVLEAVRECLQDVYDIPALVELLTAVHHRRVRVAQAAPPAASPFARSLLFGYVAEYLYEGDSPLAERRAAALTLDPALLSELLGQADLRELLDPEAIRQVVDSLQRLSEDRHARGPEDTADLLRALGPLSSVQAGRRGVAREWLEQLAGERRVFRSRIGGQEVWAVVEDAPRLRDALGAPLPPGLPEAHLLPLDDPVGDVLARFARTHGPFTAAEAVAGLGLPLAVVEAWLRGSADRGRVLAGQFLPGSTGAQWCHPDVLRLIKRRSVALLRQQIEPVSQAALGAFLPQWQHLRATGRTGPRGPDGVLAAIRLLAGMPVPSSALEQSILPARVGGYSPAMLDELTSAGEVVWAGVSPLPGSDAWVALAPADLALLLPRDDEADLSAPAQELLGLLDAGGGWFLADLVTRLPGGPQDPAAVGRALTELLWAGLVSNDTIDPIRTTRPGRGRAAGRHRPGRVPRGRYASWWRPPDTGPGPSEGGPGVGPSGPGGPAPGAPPEGSRRSQAGASRGPGRGPGAATGLDLSGRWYSLPRAVVDPAVRAVAAAQAHLDRLGLVTRGAVLAAGDPGGFAGAYRTLSAMEERGRVQRVYAVEGLGAAQFALPGVVDELRAVERALDRESPAVLVLAAADPANAYGAALEWPARQWHGADGQAHRPARAAGSHVVLLGGRPVLYVERGGRTLLTFPWPAEDDPSPLRPAVQALAEAVRSGAVAEPTISKIDGLPAMEPDPRLADVVAALDAAGFTLTPRGYRARRAGG